MLILNKAVSSELESYTEDWDTIVLRDKHVHWSIKKIVGKIMQKFIQKFGTLRNLEVGDEIEFAKEFQEKYSLSFLESNIAILLKRKTHFVGPKTTHFALKYVFYSLNSEVTFKALCPHLDNILFEILVPLL